MSVDSYRSSPSSSGLRYRPVVSVDAPVRLTQIAEYPLKVGACTQSSLTSKADRIWLFGGVSLDNKTTSALHILDITSSKVKSFSKGLPARRGHSASMIDGTTMAVFGGYTANVAEGISQDLHLVQDNGTCEKVSASGLTPAGRYGHASFMYEGRHYVLGGTGAGSELLADCWAFDFDKLTWSEVSFKGSFSPRSGMSVVISDNLLYIHGGSKKGKNTSSDFIRIDLATLTVSQDFVSGKNPPAPPSSQLVKMKTGIVLVGSEIPHAHLFNPITKAWATIPFRMSREKVQVIVIEGIIYMVEGALTKDLTVRAFQFKSMSMDADDDSMSMSMEQSIDEASYSILFNAKEVPREEWEALAMERHSVPLSLREVFRSSLSLSSYGETPLREATENVGHLQATTILHLIMQWLREKGFTKTLEELTKVTRVTAPTPTQGELGLLLDFAARLLKDVPVLSDTVDWSWKWDQNLVRITDHLQSFSKDLKSNRGNSSIWKIDDDFFSKPLPAVATVSSVLIYLLMKPGSTEEKRAFIWCTTLWSKPLSIFQILLEVFHPPPTVARLASRNARKAAISFVKIWLHAAPQHFAPNSPVMNAFETFIDLDLARRGNHSLVEDLKTALAETHETISLLKQYPFLYDATQPPSDPEVPRSVFTPSFSLSELGPMELSRQLTVYAHFLLRQISPAGLFAYVNDAKKASPVSTLLELNSRIQVLVSQQFDELSSDDIKGRARIFERYVQCSIFLYELHNYAVLSPMVKVLIAKSTYLERKKTKTAQILYKVYDPTYAKAVGAEADLERLNKEIVPFIKDGSIEYNKKVKASKFTGIPVFSRIVANIEREVKSRDIIEGTADSTLLTALAPDLQVLHNAKFRRYNLLPVHQVIKKFAMINIDA
eukprot:TRINITY_DN3556_c0_g1_i1.p1 TRINITY_DN3556_c0_g1~~TRINITY_DN3556_c0_g1_i1.p1  ORF type:complete len:889 (+),score=159.22 TRINITY_DN3556_c0_g1_i1:132-2798(+)